MPVDSSVFNNIHSFQDYNMANQDFLARQQAANIAAQQQSSVLKGQALYAAAQTGDQGTYSAALQKLSQNGIDVSDVPQDVATGTKYAEGLRQAQSPLGTLLNAASKLDANQIAANTAAGKSSDPNAIAGAVLTGKALSTTIPQPSPQTITPAQGNALPPSAFTASLTNPQPLAANSDNLDTVLQTTVNPQNATTPLPLSNAPEFIPPKSDPNKTQAANQAAYQQALDAFNTNNKAALAGSVTTAEENAKKNVLQDTGALGSKDILRLYGKLGNEAPNVPGGIANNLWADLTNAANSPSQGAINRGTYDADLNNLYLATIRSLAGTGRVQKAELDKIAEAAPKDSDSTDVKISKANAHLEDYNQRMVDMGFNPSTGQRLAQGEQPQLVPQVPTPGNQSMGQLPVIQNPQDPQFDKLQSGSKFIGPDGIMRVKH